MFLANNRTMIINKKFFTNKNFSAIAFTVGVVLAVGGSVIATTLGTNLSVDGTATLTGSTAFNGGITASGAVANDFSGSTGTFKTSTGAVTIGTGAVTISGATTFSSTAAIGSSGTAMTQALNGTCNALMPNKKVITASSTLYMDCAVTGVVLGDKVFVQMPPAATSTINATSTQGGWLFVGAVASTTSGYITLAWQNKIGQATQIPHCGSSDTVCGTTIVSGSTAAVGANIGLGSSTQYWIIR